MTSFEKIPKSRIHHTHCKSDAKAKSKRIAQLLLTARVQQVVRRGPQPKCLGDQILQGFLKKFPIFPIFFFEKNFDFLPFFENFSIFSELFETFEILDLAKIGN